MINSFFESSDDELLGFCLSGDTKSSLEVVAEVELLLSNNKNYTKKDITHALCLSAIIFNDLDLVKLLVKHGADIPDTIFLNIDPAKSNSYQIVEFLINNYNGANKLTSKHIKQLRQNINKEHLPILKKVILEPKENFEIQHTEDEDLNFL